MQTEYNGSMGLMKVKQIVQRNMGLNVVYSFKFIADKRILIATKFHAFLTLNNEAKRIDELCSGDEIWVMLSELYSKL